MSLKSFATGFGLAGILGLAGAIHVSREADKLPLVWPPPFFFAYGDGNDAMVDASGTLTGEDMSGKTFLKVECRRASMECKINELSSHSHRVVSLWNDAYPVASWGDETIIAESAPPPDGCNRVKLVIIKATETVQYVRIPQPNVDREKCKAFERKTFTWTIGDQPLS